MQVVENHILTLCIQMEFTIHIDTIVQFAILVVRPKIKKIACFRFTDRV